MVYINSMEKISDKTAVKTKKKPRGRPFGPGNKGNIYGRPPAGKAIAEMVRAKMREQAPGQAKSYGELLVETWMLHAFGKAHGGNSTLMAHSWKMLAEYDSGKPVQPVAGEGGGPIEIEITKRIVSENRG